jgi:hypothetical protein
MSTSGFMHHLQAMSLPHVVFPALINLCDDCEGGGGSEDEEGDRFEPEAMPNFIKALLIKMLYH